MSVQNVAANNDLRPVATQSGAAAISTYGQIRVFLESHFSRRGSVTVNSN